MSEQNTTATEQAVETNSAATTPCVLHPTRSEAEAAKPSDAPKSPKVFEVRKDGAVLGFMLGRGYDPCLAALARKDGYAVSLGTTPAVTKEAVASKLAEFSDDELGLTRKPQRGGKK
jgi:hypothetical protein